MKRSILMVIAIIGILGSCATLAVASPITDLGTMQYNNNRDETLRVELNSSQAIELTYITSDINKSALTINEWWFSPTNNKTTYIFVSEHIIPEWWFTPEIKYFLYQDISTNKLYSVSVNYTDINISENPDKERHQQLEEDYKQIIDNYNLTNATLANITSQFNELNDIHNQKMQLLNMTLIENHNLSENLTDLKTAVTELDDDYNKTYALWESAVGNVTTLQRDYDGLSGDYDQLEKDHNDLSGAMPWYILIGIIGTFLFTYIYVRRKNIFEAPSQTATEITTRYGKLHSAIDKHILSRFRGGPKTGDEGGIEEIDEWKEVPAGTSKDDFTPGEKEKIQKSLEGAKEGKITPLDVEKPDDILTIMHKKIDANTRAINTKIDDNARETNLKIKTLFEGIDERIKKLAKGTKA